MISLAFFFVLCGSASVAEARCIDQIDDRSVNLDFVAADELGVAESRFFFDFNFILLVFRDVTNIIDRLFVRVSELGWNAEKTLVRELKIPCQVEADVDEGGLSSSTCTHYQDINRLRLFLFWLVKWLVFDFLFSSLSQNFSRESARGMYSFRASTR